MIKKIIFTLALLFIIIPAHAQEETPSEPAATTSVAEDEEITFSPNVMPKNIVVLRGIDKITTRIINVEVPVNKTIAVGTLQVTARQCYQTPPEETPESAAFLEITDHPPDKASQQIFSGWMFASSPSISAFDHPVYDLWVTECKN